MSETFQNDLYALVHWSNMWQLTITVSKNIYDVFWVAQ